MRRIVHAGLIEAAGTVATVLAYPLGVAGEALEALIETACGRPTTLGTTPALLVHGYGANKSCFLPLAPPGAEACRLTPRAATPARPGPPLRAVPAA